MAYEFTVCNCLRSKQLNIKFGKDDVKDSALAKLLTVANRLFKTRGTSVVAESDGIPIDDDDTLLCVREEVFMILEENDEWKINEQNDENNQNANNDSEADTIPAKKSKTSDSEVEEVGSDKVDEEANLSTILKPYTEFKNFKIPWPKLDYNLLQKLKNGCGEKRTQKFVLNKIVDELRVIGNHIPIDVITHIAEVLVKKFPDTFADKWKGGELQGKGTATAISKMKNRNNYLNRPHVDGNNLSQSLKIPLKKQNLVKCLQVGCPKWQPLEYKDGVTEDSAEQDRQYLLQCKELSLDDKEVFEKAVEALSNSFPLQRLFLNDLNNPPSFEDIETTWPCLLDTFYMMLHSGLLTGCTFASVGEEIKADIPSLLAYGQLKQLIDIQELDTDEKQYIAAMKIVFQYFKEDFTNLFITIPPDTDFNDITLTEEHPTILILESVPENNVAEESTKSKWQYFLFMKCKRVEEFDSFLDAVRVLLASYYVFNYLWPPEVPCFLEFLQMRYMKIFNEKTRGKSKTVTEKVHSFFRKLQQVQPSEVL